MTRYECFSGRIYHRNASCELISIFTQSCNRTTKFLLQITGLFGIVLFASYEADLTTRMTISAHELPLRNFEDVFNAQKRMIVREGTAQLSYLKNAREGTSLNKIYKSMDEDQFAPNTCKYKCIQAMLEVMPNENCSRLVED